MNAATTLAAADVTRSPTTPRSDARIALGQVRWEVLSYVRSTRRLFFTFALPLMFLVIFCALYGNDPVDEFGGRRLLTFFVPGILAYGVIMATFTNVAATITRLRETGVLKRVRGTPVAPWAYLAGHVGCVVAAVVAISAVTLAVGSLGYGVAVPWHALPGIVSAIAVGGLAFSTLGFGIARFIPNAEAGPMVVNFVLLPLTFISGIWGTPIKDGVLATIADVFPVRMLSSALQHAYDPSVHGAAISGGDLLGLALWGVAGAVLTVRFLRTEAANG